MSVWTMFVNTDFPCQDERYDYIFVEANEPCSKMFFEEIFRHTNTNIISYYVSKNEYVRPAIENTSNYLMYLMYDDHDIEINVRVICLDELINLGLVSSCLHQVNLLVCSDKCPEHTYLEQTWMV